MRKNKQYVRNIIILLVTILIILMVALFCILQSYLGKNTKQVSTNVKQEEKLEQTIELSEMFVVLIEKISDDHIMGYDIHNNKIFNKTIDQTVKVSDSYGKILPLNQIKIGDIVEVNYQEQKDRVISIGKSASVHSWTKISGVTVNTEERYVNIAGKNYTYNDDIVVVDVYGFKSNIANIGPYDIVSVQAIDDVIWSITIEEASASLNLKELPTNNGQIEIGNSRLITFKDVTEPIRLVPGKHKIVIKMRGYVPIATEIEVEAGEVYEMILQDAEIAYTTIKLNISSTNPEYSVEDCTIKVGNQTYRYGEEIRVQQDTYKIEVTEPNHKKWVTTVYLTKDELPLSVVLTAIEEEEETEDETNTSSDASSSESNNSNSSSSSNHMQAITINTDPTGAKVYIDGVLKGVTPYALELKNGTYKILLEKSGYETYSANILLDGSINQDSYLYQLKEKETTD
ncbi:MAG: PEGA domain-containing protein [Cellulosilyticum sp.]|nr:PEGA domain-containing protein [Cellulosilyticum sp.]